MTSRPPLGVLQRQPQRSLSGPGLPSSQQQQPQRPPTHPRTVSQQYLPTSPLQKETTLTFSSADSSDGTPGGNSRLGSVRRTGGSKLRLELSNEHRTSSSESSLAPDSSKPFTPSRVLPTVDAPEIGDVMSPRGSARTPATETDERPLPMPKRRARFISAVPRREPPATPAAPAKKDTRPKAWSVEVPAAAPRYPTHSKQDWQTKSAGPSSGTSAAGTLTTGYADFFPWSGDHPEDQFTETIIRQGYFDKTPVAQTETSSAKVAVFPSLKHKSGLYSLSTVLTQVMGLRRKGGQINAPSTFKPPPRVTLTDTKREVWLKDLANPAISLRRQSRTIPHGIRGKVLLEQCLNKNVPTDRAVWLAKCVGANEVRAFRRKGVNGALINGGEAKWIRDWTVFVEQFVEGVMSAFGDDDWKSKVNYAIRLATHLYEEYLVDREHYTEWLVSSLESSSQARLPMWMLMAEIYWKDLLSLRKSGRRLAIALLGHLQVMQTHPDKDIFLPLLSRVRSLLRSLLTSSPENFVVPTAWFKYRDSLQANLDIDDEPAQEAFRSITTRNQQLSATSVKSQPAARHILVKLLDSTLDGVIPDDLAVQCWEVTRDKSSLTRSLLEWSTSPYRPGATKIYVASSLLRTWSMMGIDVTASLLDFLTMDALEEPERKSAVYHLATELVRCGQFSVSRYAQWVIARGGLFEAQDVAPDGPCNTRLLVELPTHALSGSLKSLRASLLRRAAFSVQTEDQDSEMAIQCLKHTFGIPLEADGFLGENKPIPVKKLARRIKLSSWALKSRVGAWIRDHFSGDAYHAAKAVPEITPATFMAVRSILETCQDYAMLAGFLNTFTGSSNVEILASCVDTVNLNYSVFVAIGAVKAVFNSFFSKLSVIVQQQGPGARPLLASLASLASRMPGLETLSSQLHNDLVHSDRITTVDACSPVSDTMAARLQDAEGELHEEMEKLLASGNSIDTITMGRFFKTITNWFQSSWTKPDERQRAYSSLLARLRLFDNKHFGALMTEWILRLRNFTDRPPILQIFPLLITSGALSFSTILTTVLSEAGSASANSSASTPRTFMQEILQLLILTPPSSSLIKPMECYRFCILQKQLPRQHLGDVLSVLRIALNEYSSCRGQEVPLDDKETKNQVYELIRTLVLMDSKAVLRALSVKNADPKVVDLIDCITTKLLLPASKPFTSITFDQILDLTNDYTLPFCQLKLALSLALSTSTNPDTSDWLQSHLELFTKAMDRAVDARNMTWTNMLSFLSPEITQHLKNRAQARFFELIPSLKYPNPKGGWHSEHNIQTAETFLGVVDTIVRSGSMVRAPQLVSAMIDKLADLWEFLASSDGSSQRTILNHWLPLFLTFMTLHTTAFDTSKAGNEVRAKAVIVLSGILQELDSAPDFGDPSTSSLAVRVFDLALLLADSLAEDSRQQCIRCLKDVTSDWRLRYLLGFNPAPSENLMLSHREKVALGPGERRQAILGLSNPPWLQAPPPERLTPFSFRRWEILNEPTPNVGENDTSLSLTLFDAIKL